MTETSILDFFDPRGRVNRKGLAIFAAVQAGALLGLYGALFANGGSFHTGLALLINIALFWSGFAGVAKRLHDLGLSAWSLAMALAGMTIWCFGFSFITVCILGGLAFEPGGMGMVFAAVGSLLPLSVAIIWIHFARGDTGPNRFGPEPGPLGFSRNAASKPQMQTAPAH